MNSILLSCCVFIILSASRGCETVAGSLEPAAYISWVEDSGNGLHMSKQLNNLTFELQYKPLPYVIMQDDAGELLSGKKLNEKTKEIEDMQYFTFRVSDSKGGDLLRNDISSVDQFSTRLAYFSEGMQKDIKLIENNDTLHCLLFHFERTYGVDPRSTFVLGFPLSKQDGKGGIPSAFDKVFLFDDHELGAGPVYITISADNINQVPILKLN